MKNLANLLALPTSGSAAYNLYMGLSITMIILMAISALTAIVLVLLQPGNSRGIDALGGSSDTFFGKNKSNSVEAKLSRLTKILGVVFFVVALFCTFLLAFMVSR